jgi:ABC transporter substrate binding protein
MSRSSIAGRSHASNVHPRSSPNLFDLKSMSLLRTEPQTSSQQRRQQSVIPIVFAAVADPVGNNLVAGLARPGGNVTGLSAQKPDLAGKCLELLREIIPGLRCMVGENKRKCPVTTE